LVPAIIPIFCRDGFQTRLYKRIFPSVGAKREYFAFLPLFKKIIIQDLTIVSGRAKALKIF
jgi:hypothetical protein